jgi:hypothetical protein
MRIFKKLTLAMAGFALAGAANAATTTYAVSDAAGNCGSAGSAGGHGLWTNGDFLGTASGGGSPSCGNYYGMQGGSTLVVDDAGTGTATLSATATNTGGLCACAWQQLSNRPVRNRTATQQQAAGQ